MVNDSKRCSVALFCPLEDIRPSRVVRVLESRELADRSLTEGILDGGCQRACPGHDFPAPEEHLRRVVGDWVVDIDRSGDLVVLRTPPGSAHVVGSAIDRNGMDDVVGTVAGDDTVLVVARAGRGADLCATMADLAGLG